MSDNKIELLKAQQKWDEALKKGIFNNSKSEPTPANNRSATGSSENYGMSPKMTSIAANSEKINDADYWNAVFRLSRGEDVDLFGERTKDSQVLTERESANPFPGWTKGVDADNEPTKGFEPSDLEKLIKMKEDLHSLGDKIAKMVDSKSFPKKMKELQSQIDDLSDKLNPRE